MTMPSTDQLRDLATTIALSIAADVGLDYIDAIDRNAALIRLSDLCRMDDPRVVGFWKRPMEEQHAIAERVAKLARTAVITVTIPAASDTED